MKKKLMIEKLLLFIPISILIILSLLNMHKLGLIMNSYQNYFFKQSLWFILGFILLLILKKIKPQRLFKYSKYLYYLNIVLLILVLFIGVTVNGSKAWFSFGLFSFQPSELMKFSLALYLSEKLSQIPKERKQELKLIIEAFFYTLIPSLFVFLEPDTGAIIIYLIIMLACIIVYKINYKWYFLFITIILLFLGIFFYLYYYEKDLLIKLIGTSFFYRVDRILTFVNSDSFQLDRSLIAIGNSSFFSTHKYVYVPEYPTDFIIAFSIYHFGIFGFLIILISYFTLDIYFLIKIFKLKSLKHKMFTTAFLFMFLFAQIENIGMNLGLLPIIGIPLPFLSYGGTNILVYFLFLGILINLKNNTIST